jgi:hypothetical protein
MTTGKTRDKTGEREKNRYFTGIPAAKGGKTRLR